MIFLIKESSVVSAIALADVMYMAKDLIGMYYSTYESFADAGRRVLGDSAADFIVRHLAGTEVRL